MLSPGLELVSIAKSVVKMPFPSPSIWGGFPALLVGQVGSVQSVHCACTGEYFTRGRGLQDEDLDGGTFEKRLRDGTE